MLFSFESSEVEVSSRMGVEGEEAKVRKGERSEFLGAMEMIVGSGMEVEGREEGEEGEEEWEAAAAGAGRGEGEEEEEEEESCDG